jgi:hypothetical protein
MSDISEMGDQVGTLLKTRPARLVGMLAFWLASSLDVGAVQHADPGGIPGNLVPACIVH